uniref:Uncharacterized protein n=1 Tax=Anopheles culicifacies TaxID=139723 RepID=A0A182MLD5_9DIPT
MRDLMIGQILASSCSFLASCGTPRKRFERYVNALRFHDQIELVRLLLDALHLVLGQLHQVVHVFAETVRTLGAPLEPQLEDVVVPSALDHLVAGVVADVVQLVRHEQVLGGHLVAANEKTLNKEGKQPLHGNRHIWRYLVNSNYGHELARLLSIQQFCTAAINRVLNKQQIPFRSGVQPCSRDVDERKSISIPLEGNRKCKQNVKGRSACATRMLPVVTIT